MRDPVKRRAPKHSALFFRLSESHRFAISSHRGRRAAQPLPGNRRCGWVCLLQKQLVAQQIEAHPIRLPRRCAPRNDRTGSLFVIARLRRSRGNLAETRYIFCHSDETRSPFASCISFASLKWRGRFLEHVKKSAETFGALLFMLFQWRLPFADPAWRWHPCASGTLEFYPRRSWGRRLQNPHSEEPCVLPYARECRISFHPPS